MAKYQIAAGKLHITKGNSKIGKGIYSFSTLPGNEKHLVYANGELLTDIPGTCTKHCETCYNACYAFNSARLHHNAVIPAWAENTLLLRSGKLEKAMDEYLTSQNKKKTKVEIMRIHVSGEFRSKEDIEMWDRIAQKHPETQFGVYTKNYEAVDAFMQEHGDTEPNFVINISQWHGVADEFLAKYPGKFNIFTYDDTNLKTCGLSEEERKRLSTLRRCPAVDEKGHHKKDAKGEPITCDRCTYCYKKSGKETAVYAH